MSRKIDVRKADARVAVVRIGQHLEVAPLLDDEARAEVRRLAAEAIAERAAAAGGVLTARDMQSRGGSRQSKAQRAAWAENRKLGRRPRTVDLAWKVCRERSAALVREAIRALGAPISEEEAELLARRIETQPCPAYATR